MGMELGRGVSVDRPGGVMLELCNQKSARRFRGMVAANTSLGVALQLLKRCRNGIAMSVADPVIAADERRELDRFRCGKRCIPPGPVFDGPHGRTVLFGILLGRSVPHELFAAVWVLAFAQAGKLQRIDLA